MSLSTTHISVCICTFKRPDFLRRLLKELELQQTDGQFSYSLVIVDNDRHESAKEVVQSFCQASPLDVEYDVEPEQNIALARNKAVKNAKGDMIAFIDDDEFPARNWLLALFEALQKYKADGILGPVLAHYETKPPKWVVKGKFYERPLHKAGTILLWTQTRTGNVLLKRDVLEKPENMFRMEFGSGGEDKDFFRRMINKGYKFVWCNDAPVFESVPPERYKRSFMLRRALLRGAKTPYDNNIIPYIKSLIAIPLYLLIIPFLFFIRHHLFMIYLVKEFDHLGRLLSSLGFHVIKEKYIIN